MNAIVEQEKQGLAVSERTADLIKAGVSKNTLKAYRHALKQLSAWLEEAVASGQWSVASEKQEQNRIQATGHWPLVTDSTLAAYLTHLHDTGKSPATIAQVVAAVKWRGLKYAAGEITDKTLAGIRRDGKARGRGQVDGLTWNDIERVCSFAEASRTLAGFRDSALIRLMSDCLLRISEAVAVNVEDVDKVLTVHTSKTDQEGDGATLYVGTPTHKAIRKYRRAGGIEQGALFRRVRWHKHITPDRLSVNGARNAIKRWAGEAGIEGFISGHSLRVGSAVSLAHAGASVVDMQTAGRWQAASMPAHYARAELAERGAVARFKYGK